MGNRLFCSFWENYTENDQYFLEHIPAPVDLRFSTKLHGGYDSCSLTIPSSYDRAARRFRTHLSSHLVIYDEYYRRVWEGRCEDAEMNRDGVSLSLTGYFAHASEILHGLIYVSPAYAHEIIEDTMALTAQSYGSERTWRTKNARIARTDIDLAPQDFTGEAKAVEAIEKACRYGYSTTDFRPLYFVIYEDRICRLFPEPILPPGFVNDVNWIIPRGSFTLDSSFSLAQTRKTLWNKVWYLWDDGAPDSIGPTLSATPLEDLMSQRIHGIREAVINVTQVPEAVAQLVQQIFFERNTQPKQSFKGSIQNYVKHLAGNRDEVYRVKAGEVVLIEDLDMNVPLGPQVVGEGVDSAAGFVTRTEYSYNDNTLQMDIGTDDKTLEMILSRWGIGGGLN